jgi:hypothetical protein
MRGSGHFFQPEALIAPKITSILRRPLPGQRRGSR